MTEGANAFLLTRAAPMKRRGAKNNFLPVTALQRVFTGLISLSAGLFLNFGEVPAIAENLGAITGTALTSSNNLRLVIQPAEANPDLLLLYASDSPLGAWWKEPDFQRNTAADGLEFLTPLKAFYSQRYYRIGLFTRSPTASPALPYIRFISPNSNVRTGLTVTLLGANFAPTPAGNSVHFDLPGQSWTADVTQAATNVLLVTVPTNLPTFGSVTGVVYRVTVTTSAGTGNGVGCTVFATTDNNFMVRPNTAYITQPPGTGQQIFAVGGGVPPYHLDKQTSNEMAIAVASLTGAVLTLTARTNVTLGFISVIIRDSSTVTQAVRANVQVLTQTYSPTFDAAFHTLLGGTAPGLTMTVHAAPNSAYLQTERLELQLQNAGIEVSRLAPGQIIAFLKLFYSGTIYDYQHLVIKEVSAGRARFDVVSLADGDITTFADGELIESPPTIVVNVPNLSAVSLTPQPLDQEFVFSDDIFRLPAGAGQSFSLNANFTSVSIREDKYQPQRKTFTRTFNTTGLAAGSPRIEALRPVQGEVNRNVRVAGSGFGATPGDNAVTFAGTGGTRVPAAGVRQTNGELVVTVPREAISGPVRVVVAGQTNNDYSFFVRYHPDSVLLFNSFSNNTPTPLRLIHQQPVDDGETLGEVSPESVIATVAGGHIVVSNLTLNQQVGVAVDTSLYTSRASTNVLVYAGQESAPPQRYIFNELPSLGSSLVLGHLYYSEDTNSGLVTLEMAPGLFGFYAGSIYDFQFTSAIYRPPTTVGSSVAVRLESISQQWISLPHDRLRLVVNSTRKVK